MRRIRLLIVLLSVVAFVVPAPGVAAAESETYTVSFAVDRDPSVFLPCDEDPDSAANGCNGYRGVGIGPHFRYHVLVLNSNCGANSGYGVLFSVGGPRENRYLFVTKQELKVTWRITPDLVNPTLELYAYEGFDRWAGHTGSAILKSTSAGTKLPSPVPSSTRCLAPHAGVFSGEWTLTPGS